MPVYRVRIKAKAPAPAWDRFVWSEDDATKIFVAPSQKYNSNHAPAGGSDGGEFTSGDGGGGGMLTVTDRLGHSVQITPNSSLARHLGEKLADGSYRLDPQRELMHQQIVNQFLKGVPHQDGQVEMFMTGGGPASGKSSVLMGTGENLPTVLRPPSALDTPQGIADREAVMANGGPSAVLIDPDAIKEQIPEYVTLLKAGNPDAAAVAHEESSMIRQRLGDAAIAGNQNVLLDTTGDSSVAKLQTSIEKYRDAGYKVNALYSTNDVDLALKLAQARGEKTGRYVPETMLRETHANVSITLPRALEAHLFDSVKLYDTNIYGHARLIATGDRKGYTVVDPQLWATFKGKANSGYATAGKSARKAGSDPVETDRMEMIMVAILNKVPKAKFTMTANEAKFWDVLAKELKAGPPEGGIWDIGNELGGPDLSNLYSDGGVQAIKAENLHPGAITNTQWVTIKKTDDEKQIVYGEVYAPWVLDTYGEFMTPEDIETMAHRFMRLDLTNVIDTQHDNQPNGSFPVESFVAREGDPDYTPGAWVLGVKVPDDTLWHAVKSGQLNGFSFQCLVKPTSVDVEIDAIRDFVGETEANEDHSHTFFVELDDIGNVVSGRTSAAADGHTHDISRASTTDRTYGHIHRFFL